MSASTAAALRERRERMEKRHAEILSLLSPDKETPATEIQAQFNGVARRTIQNDLGRLADQGKITVRLEFGGHLSGNKRAWYTLNSYQPIPAVIMSKELMDFMGYPTSKQTKNGSSLPAKTKVRTYTPDDGVKQVDMRSAEIRGIQSYYSSTNWPG